MTRKPLQLGIIGFGIFGEKRIVPGSLRTEDVEIVGIQKRSLEAAKEKANLYDIPYYYDNVDDLLGNDEIEAVFVASPNNLHSPQTIAAANAGKHIICEKPMAMNAPECVDMIKACEHNNVMFMIAHCQRYLETVGEIRDIVQSGALGEIRFAEMNYSFWADKAPRTWFYDKEIAGGGALYDVGVHAYDTLRYILGEDGQSVYSQTIPADLDLKKDVDRHMQCALGFQSGILGSIKVSFDSEYDTYIDIRGSEGAIWTHVFVLINTRVHIYYLKNGEKYHFHVENKDMYAAELEAFAKAIRGNQPSPIPGVEGLKNQLFLDTALKATKSPLPIPAPDL